MEIGSGEPRTTTALRVDPVLEHVSIIRAVARMLADRCGFALEEIAEVTDAIDEVGAILIDVASFGSPLHCSFVETESALFVTSTVTSHRGIVRHPGVRWRVLEALTDRLLITDLLGESEGEREVVVGFVKHRHGFI